MDQNTVRVQATRNIGGQGFTLSRDVQTENGGDGEQTDLAATLGWIQAQFDFLESRPGMRAIEEVREETTSKLRAHA